jgi:hypothetical protein
MTNLMSLWLMTCTLLGAATASTNLITNGDFEAGAAGFTTDQALGPNVSSVGTFTVGSTVSDNWTPGFGDHTSGAGLMAI